MKTIARFATLGIVAVSLSGSLSGCTVMHKLGLWHPHKQDGRALAAARPVQPTAMIDTPAPPAAASAPVEPVSGGIVQARTLLAAGAYDQAIALFRAELAAGHDQAAAFNGLAVAYVKTGQVDLAERYFRSAVAVDPGEPRYAANLARLLEERRAAQLASQAQEQQLAEADDEEDGSRDGRLTRTGDHEYALRSCQSQGCGAVALTRKGGAVARATPRARKAAHRAETGVD